MQIRSCSEIVRFLIDPWSAFDGELVIFLGILEDRFLPPFCLYFYRLVVNFQALGNTETIKGTAGLRKMRVCCDVRSEQHFQINNPISVRKERERNRSCSLPKNYNSLILVYRSVII